AGLVDGQLWAKKMAVNATEEKKSLLAAWKKYRVLLNRVDTSTAPDIEWPTSPVE
ncbi:tail fiber assembly protein, partial [Escherichia coli]|uniref:tail fiber assembly protein n=2 Tax=Escherichia coli TaxID=562 RepID=UPI0032B5A103